jgi:sortase A
MNSSAQQTSAASSTRKSLFRAAIFFFLGLGVLNLGYASFVFLDAHHYQAVQSKKLESASLPSIPHDLTDGEMLGEIQVPRLHLHALVAQGDSSSTLRRAVGHLSESPLPGETGNVTLAGHRDTFFRPLRDIRVGDEIRFKTRQRSFVYRVESIEVVSPADTSVLNSSTGHYLTLLTCFPIHYIGPAPKRLVVRAREVENKPQVHFARKNAGKT